MIGWKKKALAIGLGATISAVSAMPASAAELSGVKMSDSRKVGNETLVLNGLGLRKKAIFKVYVAGLYLPAKQSNPELVLKADTPRAVDMEFLRTVGKESLAGAWEDCLESNNPGAAAEVEKGFDKLGSLMVDVESGDRIGFVYTPGDGLTVEIGGRSVGKVEGKAVADALFRCWLGPNPPGEDLKEGMLGR